MLKGKSTTLKSAYLAIFVDPAVTLTTRLRLDFQLINSPKVRRSFIARVPPHCLIFPKAFKAERASWRAVIQLNLARSIRYILEVMDEHLKNSQPDSGYASPVSVASSSSRADPLSRSTSPINELPTDGRTILTQEHLRLKMRLSPLLQVEESLWRRLSPTRTPNYEGTHLPRPISKDSVQVRDPSVNSTSHWKDAFGKLLSGNARPSLDENAGIDFNDPNDPGVVLHNCAEDMVALWSDSTVRELIRKQGTLMEDTPGLSVLSPHLRMRWSAQVLS
jgi:guanine nucleotide-binding protein alpha-1 subunit